MRKSVSVSISDELLGLLDGYCRENYCSRSQALVSSFLTVYQQRLAVREMSSLNSLLSRLSSGVPLDESDREMLARLDRAVEVIQNLADTSAAVCSPQSLSAEET